MTTIMARRTGRYTNIPMIMEKAGMITPVAGGTTITAMTMAAW